MRPLTEEETRIFFEKLVKYIGRNLETLIDQGGEPYCFRMQKDRVYYISEKILTAAISIPRDELLSAGTCFGKFTKTKKFRLHITSLKILAQYANFKVWIKQSGEMSLLYGNNVLKSHVGRMTEDITQNQGVVIYTMSDIPIGFGVAARSSVDYRKLEPTGVCVYLQADIGEYLRNEGTIV